MADPIWLAKAKTLPAGHSTRIECCASDRSMLVSNDRKGYRGYCFRCHDKPFVAHGEFSLETLARRKAEFALITEKEVRLPSDFSTEIPPDEATWLYKAGISSELAKHYGIGWSEYFGRIIVPVYNRGELVAYTARMRNGRPKYIEKSKDPGGLVFQAAPNLLLPSYAQWAATDGPDIVFVEDNLSCIRVGRVAKHVVSLMGTSANRRQLVAAFGSGSEGLGGRTRRIAVWLDPDNAGRTAQRTLCAALRVYGHEVRSIRSGKDPKYYSYAQIKEHLCD